MRRRLGWWLVIAVLAAGCSTSNANEGTPSDQTDVWFMQHMAGHLLQTTAILDLAGDRITRPELARLANTMDQQRQAHLQQLQGWLDSRGLAPYDPQQDPNRRKESDLSRLSRVRGAGFDLAFLEVMMARHRAGRSLAATEFRKGGVPEVRQLAAQLLAEHEAQVNKMTAWRRTWAKTTPAGAQADPAAGLAGLQCLVAGSDGGETARAFLDKAGRFPVLIEHLKALHVDPTDHCAGGSADSVGWAN